MHSTPTDRARGQMLLLFLIAFFLLSGCIESPFASTIYRCREGENADCTSGFVCTYSPSAEGDWWCMKPTADKDTDDPKDTSDADTSGSHPPAGEQQMFGGAAYRFIPPGTFTMGSPDAELFRDPDEPQHEVTISRGFWMKETEVTQAEWQALMGNNPSDFTACGSNCPLNNVTWWDAVAYCNALSEAQFLAPCYVLTGCTGTPGARDYTCTDVSWSATCEGYRLPTESEWEFSARAGTTTAFYHGDLTGLDCEADPVLDLIGWYRNNAGDTAHPVAQKMANTWGLYDMSGNVWEWVWDRYGAYPNNPQTDPLGGTTPTEPRIFRGGAWFSCAQFCRSAQRYTDYATLVLAHDLGFRTVRVWVP